MSHSISSLYKLSMIRFAIIIYYYCSLLSTAIVASFTVQTRVRIRRPWSALSKIKDTNTDTYHAYRTKLFLSKSSVEIKNETETNKNPKRSTVIIPTEDNNDLKRNNVDSNDSKLSSSSTDFLVNGNNNHKHEKHFVDNTQHFNDNELFTSQLLQHDQDDGKENKTTQRNETTTTNKNQDNNKSYDQSSSSSSSSPLSWTDWSPSTTLGSLLLKRKKLEEEEMKKLQDLKSNINIDDENKNNNDDRTRTKEGEKANIIPTSVQMEIDQTLKTLASEAEGTFVSFIDLTTGKKDKDNGKKKKKEKDTVLGLDKELVREVDESITRLSTTTQQNLMKDIDVLPFSVVPTQQQRRRQKKSTDESVSSNLTSSSETDLTMLPLSGKAHTARIEKDIKHLAVSIASTIDDAEQWNKFIENGGGLLPLLECIRDCAKEIDRGPWENVNEEGMLGLVEKREEAFAVACKACKTLRDLCAISKPFASIVTDSILRANAVWSKTNKKPNGQIVLQDGFISNLITLLRFSLQADNLYSRRSRRQKIRALRKQGVQRVGSGRQKRNSRKRCALYVTQLLLEMAFASDKAVDVFRATDGFADAILSGSSYAPVERLRRRWIRYPTEVIKRFFSPKSKVTNEESPFLAAASMNSGISGLIQGSANQLLAAIGHNVWYPKTAGQRGLRILCLDGGGTRGITAISSMRSIVNALGGLEVCDAFDMIVGTSTGAIIAFLVGLRRESSAQARKRYDKLIKRIFVKSALSTPMLLFTTATYDETPFNTVVGEILRENSMLSSRADPRVPLVFAISSKMSSTPTQICLFRNYNYGGGEMRDSFVQDPIEAKKELEIELQDDIFKLSRMLCYEGIPEALNQVCTGSRHPGSFRVLQRAALRATTAAPTVFKPVLMGGELYCDGGIVASNPTAVAIHEARTVYPNVPIELVVSCGTGAFVEEKNAPRIGWDGIIGQIVNSATDGEQVHHILEDILGGQGSTTRLGSSPVSQTKYYRFQPVVGTSDTFPIDGTDPVKLEELSQLTTRYMNEPDQQRKLKEIVDLLRGQVGWKGKLLSKLGAVKKVLSYY